MEPERMNAVSSYPPELVSQIKLKERMKIKADRASRAYEISYILECSPTTMQLFYAESRRAHLAWRRAQERLVQIQNGSPCKNAADCKKRNNNCAECAEILSTKCPGCQADSVNSCENVIHNWCRNTTRSVY